MNEFHNVEISLEWEVSWLHVEISDLVFVSV